MNLPDKRPRYNQDEDDDGTMGRPSNSSHGMRIPNFTDDDRRYLETSTSSEQYAARLMEIARTKDRQRKINNAKTGAQTAEDYIESLRRQPPDLSDKPYDSKGTSAADDYMDSLNVRQPPDLTAADYSSTGLNSGEDYIHQLSKMRQPDTSHQSKTSDQGEPSTPSESSFEKVQEFQSFLRSKSGVRNADLQPEPALNAEKIEKDIKELETQLRKMISEGDDEGGDVENAPPSAEDVDALNRKLAEMQKSVYDPANDPVGKNDDIVNTTSRNVSEMDQQIRQLEEYLETLTGEEQSGSVSQSDTADDDSHDEESNREGVKNKINDAVRGLGRKVEEVPGKASEVRLSSGELSEKDKEAAFEAIRKQVMKQKGQSMSEFADPLAAPLPEKKISLPRDDEDDDFDIDSAKIPEAYFAVSEIEAEVKKYMYDARSLLSDHERRMNVLLAKLRELE